MTHDKGIERARHENTNGFMRRYLPKKTNFSEIDIKQ
jgi:IS30 family transposase